MKLLLQATFLFGILIFVNCQGKCSFTANELNGQILTTIKIPGCVDKCFTSNNVRLTVNKNSTQITSLQLTAVNYINGLMSATITPDSKSLYIDPFFQVENTVVGQASNFLKSCSSQNNNGNIIYTLEFNAQVEKTQVQSFSLKYSSSSGGSGSASSSFILKLSLSLIFSMILLF